MGPPLMTNWFVSDLGQFCFINIWNRKYIVDDIFYVFRSDKQSTEFNEKLNNLHKAMIFTMETRRVK